MWFADGEVKAMYLRQKCPNCNHVAEYVYVQIGHSHCCKKCNYEFTLEPKKFTFLPVIVWVVGACVLAVGGYFLLKALHDWWIYR